MLAVVIARSQATKQPILPLHRDIDGFRRRSLSHGEQVASFAMTTVLPHCVIFFTPEYPFRKL
jgi:hypothetical protein